MKIVIFGLTVSSSWGNGHATLWRGLCGALARRGHEVVFFEKDAPYYASNRDMVSLPAGATLRIYDNWEQVKSSAYGELHGADVAITTSYCPDGVDASELILESNAALKIFYDLDTPVTLDRLERGNRVEYLPERGLHDFDLVLSYTGGRAIEELRRRLGALHVVSFYGSVDPATHFSVPPVREYRSDLSYLGTYAEDRQAQLNKLFLEPARVLAEHRFLLGGAQYPEGFPWTPNIFFVRHMPPPLHSAFFCSSRATLNITRRAMAEYGYCPSGRLFEAAACGVPLFSDTWEGLDTFLAPGKELVIVRSAQDVVNALERSDHELHAIAEAARERVLEEHTAEHRVKELEALCERFSSRCAGLELAY